MNNILKSDLQKREFENLKSRYRAVLRWATGCGKSKMAIDLVNNAAQHYSTKPKVVFVVAEKAHIKNWDEEFNKWGLDRNKIDLTVLCYASLHKLKNSSIDILVLDEAHHCFTEKRMSILETFETTYVYLLSATFSWKKIVEIESMWGKFEVSTVSLKDAISSDILPDPRVIVIDMNLDNTIVNQEIKIGESGPTISWNERKKYIYKNQPCIIRCTQKQKYEYITTNMEYWKQRYEYSHNPYHHNKWVNLGSQRKRFLGELKTTYVKQLISSFSPYKRFICFCASVAQANELDQENTISSKRTSTLNQQIIDAFNSKKLHRIYAVGMANEGLNLTDIQAGVIVQLDGKERLFVQKFGRSLRAQDPVTYIFYFKDTQDENYLRGALENIEAKYVKHISINDLITLKDENYI